MSYHGKWGNQLAYPHRVGFGETAYQYGSSHIQNGNEFSIQNMMPMPPGGEKYTNHPLAHWMYFFGANPKVYDNKDPTMSYRRDVLNLPEAFRGECAYLDQVMINMLTRDDLWPITEMLPWKEENNSLTVRLNRYYYDDHMLSRTPEQAPSRILTQHYDEKSMSMVRYGIALMVEHGFWKTPRGVASFMANLEQIKNATLETLMFAAQEAILHIDRTGWMENSLGLVRTFDEQLAAERREMRRFGIVQKTERGFQIALDMLKEDHLAINRTPGDYLIMGQGVQKYAASFAGLYNEGPRTELPKKVRTGGITTREFRPPRLDSAAHSMHPERVIAVIGGFIKVCMNHLANVPPEEFKTQYMDVYGHDEKSDDYFCVSYQEGLKKSGLFKRTGAAGGDGGGGAGFGGNASYTKKMKEGKFVKSDQPRWTLTPSGARFFAGCASWGNYMVQHGLLEKWMRSFMAKKLNVKQQFLARFKRTAIPGADGWRENAGRNSVLYGQYQGMIELVNAVKPLLHESKEKGDGDGKYSGGGGGFMGELETGADPTSSTPVKVYSRLMLSAIDSRNPGAEAINGVKRRVAFANLAQALSAARADLQRLYMSSLALGGDDSGLPIAVVADGDIPPTVIRMPGDKLPSPKAKDLSLQTLANYLISNDEKAADKEIAALKPLNVPKNTAALKFGGVQRLFDGIVTVQLLREAIKNQRPAKELIQEIGNKVFNDKLNSASAWERAVPVAGRFNLVGETRIGPRVAEHLQSEFYLDHKDDIDAIYSKLRPKGLSDVKFVRLINALAAASSPKTNFKNDPAAGELGASLFLSDLYHGVLEANIIGKLDAVKLLDGGKEALLADDLAGALARLVGIHNDSGEDLLTIIPAMQEDSMTKFLEHNQGETKALEKRKEAKEGVDATAANEKKAVLRRDVENLLYAIQVSNADFIFWSLDNDCWPLIYFNLLRMRKEYETSPMVLMSAYGAAGYTYHGHHNFEVGDDATLKIHYGHFTLYAGPILHDERKVVMINHAFVHDYNGGNDRTIHDGSDPADLKAWKEGTSRKSGIIQPYYPDDEEANAAERINALGQEHPEIRSRSTNLVPTTAAITADLFQLRHPIKPFVQRPYLDPGHEYSTVLMQDHYRGCVYEGNNKFKPMEHVSYNKGHWGHDDGYPGSGRCRNGSQMFLLTPNMSQTSGRANLLSAPMAMGSA